MMSPKTLIYIGMTVGGYLGSYLPTLWGVGYFSFSSIILGMFGGIIGIIIGFKLSHY
jgi:hypothetical protein